MTANRPIFKWQGWDFFSVSPDPEDALPHAVLERLSTATRVLDLFRQQHAADQDKTLRLLLRRLDRIRYRFEKLYSTANPEK